MTVFREAPPVVDENGEHSEGQVLEEFNTDELLSICTSHLLTAFAVLCHEIWQRQDT